MVARRRLRSAVVTAAPGGVVWTALLAFSGSGSASADPPTFTTTSPGSTLDLNAYLPSAAPDNSFYADDISLALG
jgi:hypothetical protein